MKKKRKPENCGSQNLKKKKKAVLKFRNDIFICAYELTWCLQFSRILNKEIFISTNIKEGFEFIVCPANVASTSKP